MRRTWQWAKRNPGLAASSTLAILLLLVMAIAGPMLAMRERRLNENLRLEQFVSSISLGGSELELGNAPRAYEILNDYRDSELSDFVWRHLWAQAKRHRNSIELRPKPPAWMTGGTIRDVAFSPDGKRLASGHWSNNVKVWDIGRRTVIHELAMPGRAQSVAFSPDGELIAAGSALGRLFIWDARTGEQVQSEHVSRLVFNSGTDDGRQVRGVAFSPDGRRLAAVLGYGDSTRIEPPRIAGALVVWTRNEDSRNVPCELEDQIRLPTSACAVAFWRDSQQVVVGTSDGRVTVYSIDDGEESFQFGAHDLPLRSLALSPNGDVLATASCDRTIKLWRTEDWSRIDTLFGHTDEVHDVAFSDDGRYLASASFDSSVKLWDGATFSEIATLWGHVGRAWCSTFSPDGRMLASGAIEDAIRIWDVEAAIQRRRNVVPLDSGAWGIAFSPDHTQIATCSETGQVQIVSTANGETIDVLRPGRLAGTSIAYSPDRKFLVRGGGDWMLGRIRSATTPPVPTQGELTVWDLSSKNEVAHNLAHGAMVKAVLFPAEDVLLSVSLDGSVQSWAFPELGEHHDIRQAGSPVFSAALSPDGQLLAVGAERNVELWRQDGDQWDVSDILEGHSDWVTGVAFSPGGRLLASASLDGTAVLWEVESRRSSRILEEQNNWVLSVAFSRDGRTLATTSQNGIKLYNVETGGELLRILDHKSWVLAAAFSPVEDLLVTTSADATLRFWRTD